MLYHRVLGCLVLLEQIPHKVYGCSLFRKSILPLLGLATTKGVHLSCQIINPLVKWPKYNFIIYFFHCLMLVVFFLIFFILMRRSTINILDHNRRISDWIPHFLFF